jgi:hypothetical protein
MALITCPGCKADFLHGAWSIHLAQTQNPGCRAIYEEQQAYIPGSSDRAPSASPQPDLEYPLPEDDFLGNTYEPEFVDWGYSSDDRHSDLNASDSGSSEAESEYHLEVPTVPPPSLPSSDDDSDPDDPMDDERGRLLNRTERQIVEDTILVNPIVCPFPGYAGQALSEAGPSEYAIYEEQVGADIGNIYTPFESKVDWEFARWAKHRGVGSTAVSDLMGLDGVSRLLYFFYHGLM